MHYVVAETAALVLCSREMPLWADGLMPLYPPIAYCVLYVHGTTLVSFPPHARLWLLAVWNTEGEGLGDLSISGRQMINTCGVVPDWTANCVDAALQMLLASNPMIDITRKAFKILESCHKQNPLAFFFQELHIRVTCSLVNSLLSRFKENLESWGSLNNSLKMAWAQILQVSLKLSCD